jgi:hypothetical protein
MEDQEKELSNNSIDDTGKSITLESMRIRVFVVEYKPKNQPLNE